MPTNAISIALALLLPATLALQIPGLQPFFDAVPQALQDLLPAPVSNASAHDVLKRQYSNTCPKGFNSCQNLGAPNLCCVSDAICSPDQAGNVACCPSGAVCTGTISGVIYSGTVAGDGQPMSTTAFTTDSDGSTAPQTTSFQQATSTTGNGLVQASTQSTTATDGDSASTGSGGGFIIDGTSTVASPGIAARGVQPPAIARAIVQLLQYLAL